ncbi:MAG: N-acetyltransferase family protein [Syntrophomonas sp.]
MEYTFRRVTENDKVPVIDIFNYYIEHSFAAFLDQKLSYDSFQPLLEMTTGYPFYVIEDETNAVLGFGFLGKYHPSEAFNHVAELSYFILPPHVQKGLGTQLLNILSVEAKELGIEALLANITSLNLPSLNFHLKQGFTECGRFVRIGKKHNTVFDVVWMQKFI